MTLVQTEPKKILYWESIIVSDMQWPCPDGFHIPLNTERQAVHNIWTSLGWWSNDWTNFWIALKMPFAGRRTYSAAGVYNVGTTGFYWSSTPSNRDAFIFWFKSSEIDMPDDHVRASGHSVRPFKNAPVVPTSSWTKLYWTSIESWWIFWSSTDWLISLSSDWQTWITMQDKNLWATTVWNSWDTLTDDNCGTFYQRWNNYWFAHSWTVTTSSTQVNAGNYWPWNYYNSSTFIIWSDNRSSVQNDNIRWWVSQWTTEKTKEVKAVYLWENKVRPSIGTRTFTISRTEQSNMSSWWTYSDDAAWLTAWDSAFDEFFWYYGCRLNASGVETAKITQEESWWAWKLDITQLWTLTSGDNVMIKFPVRWIKMTKNWSVVTLSITDWLGRESDWYQYYAFCTWTLSNPWTPKDAMYLWAYEWCSSSSVIKSWSWRNPIGSQTQSTFITRAKANGSGYNIVWFYQRMYIAALYMMKYGNPNSQSVVWRWYTSWSSKVSTWWTDSQTNATYWTTSWTVQCKLFWLEDRWGNVREYIWWMCTDSNYNLWTALSWFTWEVTTSSPYENTGATTKSKAATYSTLKTILWDNKWLFMPIDTVSSSRYSTYYCDGMTVTNVKIADAWWDYNDGLSPWVFNIYGGDSSADSSSNMWVRLMYINWLT
jgi:hypothetical protein